jgi:rhodanese-related sulfurtransferase
LFITARGAFDVRSVPLDRVESISVQELAAWRHSVTPHTVLDVREADELGICQLEDAMHIPMSEIPSRVADLPLAHPLVVMCHHGMRSMRVVIFLRGAGYPNAVNLDGGMDAWACEIDQSLRRY